MRFSVGKSKGKGKIHPRTGHEDAEGEQMYSSTLSSTSALEWVGGQRHVPAALPPGNTRHPWWVGPRAGPVCTGTENLAPPGFDPRTVQGVASRYSD
jgi:hypothetical protein